MKKDTAVSAIVMNMFYTGLGIARSLGENDIPVIGLTAHRGIYGNFTRCCRTLICPDSRKEPEALMKFLTVLGKRLGHRAVIFPTRDDDLVFLDRFRGELNHYFSLAIPARSVLQTCLNKWETYRAAVQAGVPTPRSWQIESEHALAQMIGEVTYPCVLKPVCAHQWRRGDNWQIVGARKAIGISSREELLAEYRSVAKADNHVLLQELIPGGDESLVISACLLDFKSRLVAGFNTQKLVQVPETFGTGCIVQAASYPELTTATARLLESMKFTGVAEVEYKWDAGIRTFRLIEINPRPWDQHRLGKTCGVDLVYLSYCEHAGLPRPACRVRPSKYKWVAEDAFVNAAASLLWRRSPKLRSLFRLARGKRIYAIWSGRDPLPFIAYFGMRFLPGLLISGVRMIWRAVNSRANGARTKTQETELVYATQLEREESHR